MTEDQFFAYSLHVQQERFYHPNWAFVVFKAKFDKWVTKTQKQSVKPLEPTGEYLEWLNNHQKEWSTKQKDKAA